MLMISRRIKGRTKGCEVTSLYRAAPELGGTPYALFPAPPTEFQLAAVERGLRVGGPLWAIAKRNLLSSNPPFPVKPVEKCLKPSTSRDVNKPLSPSSGAFP